MHYQLSYNNPNHHYLDIAYTISKVKGKRLQLQLPAWRPGRYELGNFAKNIQQWEAYNSEGEQLNHKKLKKDLWEVETNGASEITIRYNYFSNELNAGSTYLDAHQLYVNGVNCFLYVPDRQNEACTLSLTLPEDYQVATSLQSIGGFEFSAKDFDELVDSPFIASNSLQHHQYEESGVTFHLWFQGECKPDFQRLENDFVAFSKSQIKLFGELPMKAYHFLYQITSYKSYHGVEHSESTVCMLGPSYAIMKTDGMYEELLGVSSHELFHAWNVKRIRPIEMWPYDYSQENYSRLGYLAEGATTYYGDLMLLRSNVFNAQSYFKTFNQLLDRHFNNPGVLNLSVAESSFDTWLDGYVPGVPNRKSSIYTEGALISFMLDVIIRKETGGKANFDDVMRAFYTNYYKKGRGISEADYQKTVEEVAGKPLQEFFQSFVNGAEDYSQRLKECMAFIGLEYDALATDNFNEAYLGFRIVNEVVFSVYPDSPAAKAGLSVGDKPIAVNGYPIQENVTEWCAYFNTEPIQLLVKRQFGATETITMQATDELFYRKHLTKQMDHSTSEQKEAFKKWSES